MSSVSGVFVNQRTEIERVVEFAERFGEEHQLPAELVMTIHLVLDEVVANIINHAYDDAAEHQIRVTLALEDSELGIRVEDDGRAFDPLAAPPPDLDLPLEERLDNPIGSLSGGQRQALTLLMASWLKPKLLLLDEHTAALDPKSADQVIRLSEAIVARDKLTTLMVTHSMSQAASLGDRLVMMNRGSVLHDFRGSEKQRLRAGDLLNRFEDVRRAELLDEPAAGMLRRLYV